MNTTKKTRLFAAATLTSLALLTTACGSDTDEPTKATESADSSQSSDMGSDMGEEPMASDSAGDMASTLVGPGCADYAKAVPTGAGSVDGMAQDPVATAAGNNPLLKTLTAAVSGKLNSKVNLVDTLNGGEFTVFAPVDDAFAKLPAETVKTLGTPAGADTLSSVLTYHVIPGRIAPADIDGTFTTVNGAKLTVAGAGDSITVGDAKAGVICGGVQTANATVYLVDSVLMPPA